MKTVYPIALVLLAGISVACSDRSMQDRENEQILRAKQQVEQAYGTTDSQSSAENAISITVSRKDFKGITQEHFDQAALKEIEADVEAIFILSFKDKANLDITTEALYAKSGSRKLAVIRASQRLGKNWLVIYGEKDDQLVKIFCFRESSLRIPLTDGPCAEKIKEVFGFKIEV